MELINEALKGSYDDVKVEELTIQEFRERYMGIEFRKIYRVDEDIGSREDIRNTIKFGELEKAIVRYIPYNDTADFVDSAVVFGKGGQSVMEFRLYGSLVLGVFYIAGKSGEWKGTKNIDLIYEDLSKNPIQPKN